MLTIASCYPPSYARIRSRAAMPLTFGRFAAETRDRVLAEIGDDRHRPFFEAIFSPHATSANALSAHWGLESTVLLSRFFRAGLPSVKQYIVHAKLVLAAYLAETQSLNDIADRLSSSSHQSFSRMVHVYLGMTPGEMRRRYTGETMRDRFLATMIVPHVETWRAFAAFVPVEQ